jgi:molybdate transport system regulatory protein
VARLILRIELGSRAAIGGEHIRLLELVETTGSITAAGRAHGLSYRRAWTLLDELNRMFKAPVLAAQSGGPDGGGARLTPFGHEMLARWRTIERCAAQAAQHLLAEIEAAATPEPPNRR